jgi:hypothetical protein
MVRKKVPSTLRGAGAPRWWIVPLDPPRLAGCQPKSPPAHFVFFGGKKVPLALGMSRPVAAASPGECLLRRVLRVPIEGGYELEAFRTAPPVIG